MGPEAFKATALGLPGASVVVQWGDNYVYKVGDRIFAITDSTVRTLSVKVSDIAFEALIEGGRASPAPYLARAKWVRFDDLAALDAAEVTDWLQTAHALVTAKLTKAARREVGLV